MPPFHGSNASIVMPLEQLVSSSHSIMDEDDESSAIMMDKTSSPYSCGALQQHNANDDEDDVSIGSIAVFSQDDFDEKTWTNVVTPTSIVAVVAGVGLLTATPFPLLLFSFYATALGAASIMSHARELLEEEYDLWKHDKKQKETASEEETTQEETKHSCNEQDDALPLQDSPIATTTINTTGVQQQQVTCLLSSDEGEDETPSSFLTAQFPPLQNVIVSETLKGLNGLEFFHVFFSDEAPFSFEEFQSKRGDVHIDYPSWQSRKAPVEHVQHLSRTVSFQTKTKSYFGPPFCSCTKFQQVYMSKRCFVLEQKVTLSDIPFSDCFYVKERWILNAPKSKIATLHVSSQVVFTKPCTFSSQIQSKSVSTLREVVTAWCGMAQQALTLTKRRKQQEQQQEEQEEVPQTVNSFGSIEVARSESSGKSFVVGDENEAPPLTEMVVNVPPPPQVVRNKGSLKNLKRSVLSKMQKRMNSQ
jgi:hypothetical protein